MNIKDLEHAIAQAKAAGITEVKIWSPSEPQMCNMITPLESFQVRAVQRYDINGNDFRYRYLLLSSHLMDHMGFT